MTARHAAAEVTLARKTKELDALEASQESALNALRNQVSKSDSKVVRLERELAASNKKPKPQQYDLSAPPSSPVS